MAMLSNSAHNASHSWGGVTWLHTHYFALKEKKICTKVNERSVKKSNMGKTMDEKKNICWHKQRFFLLHIASAKITP